MKIAAQQEDLQFLGQILQEQLRAEVPSGEFFQVKCAVNNGRLMILAQHPLGVSARTETIFAVLEEALQSLPAQQEQQVEFFLRIIGQRLPYTKHSVVLKIRVEEIEESYDSDKIEDIEDEGLYTFSDSSSSSAILDTPSIEEPEDSLFDPLADAPDLSTYTAKPASPIKNILIGLTVAVTVGFGSAAYFLSRPCVMFECKEIQTAKQVKTSFEQLKLNARSNKELPQLQQQLDKASASLEGIPSWSPHYQEAEQLSATLSAQSQEINQVLEAFKTGSLAAQKTQTPATSIQELEERQLLWRRAIAPLETINPNNKLHTLIQPRLLIYRTQLQEVKQQMLDEEKWMKKLTAAKAVAMAAAKREASAKTLEDLQKVQSTWQVAVNALTIIPSNSSVYPQAQQLLLQYKPYLAAARLQASKELLAAKAYKQAVNAANLAKRYEQQNQWQTAVTHWNQAVNAAKEIKSDSRYYSQAQSLIVPYSTALNQAQDKLRVASLIQTSRTDLNKICLSSIQVCNYTINTQGIAVQLTPEYEQMLRSPVPSDNEQQSDSNIGVSVTNHLQSLQQALTVISDNANLPIIIYDVQSNAIFVHTPTR
ncbi:MAG: hypothetical protein SAK29_36175 [Scytonema sp. PMC 1069.18]|nr:hypothetical protein [Scytonema sp. PMC 1069.18]MEC4888097.1 hypothetical protein [Scytonema sp. PMC 1070.18]